MHILYRNRICFVTDLASSCNVVGDISTYPSSKTKPTRNVLLAAFLVLQQWRHRRHAGTNAYRQESSLKYQTSLFACSANAGRECVELLVRSGHQTRVKLHNISVICHEAVNFNLYISGLSVNSGTEASSGNQRMQLFQ